MNIREYFRRSKSEDEVQWLPISDLMAGLMVIFLFIAITYMRMVVVERDQIKEVIVAWDRTQDDVYETLYNEFKNDLDDWNAVIKRDSLTVRFKEPEVLFKQGEAELQDRFEEILSDFFPRYIACLNQFSNCGKGTDGRPRGCIEEIRIEGHTSSEWNTAVSKDEAYYNNMSLSQGRTREVLRYCCGLPGLERFPWVKKKIAAIGFSSSHTIKTGGEEDVRSSRRVEFRVKTTIEKQLMHIIETS